MGNKSFSGTLQITANYHVIFVYCCKQAVTDFSFAVLYKSLGCFIDQNGDRIMPTLLHQDFNDPNIINVCYQLASARGFSVFGVEAGGQCFSGPNAGFTFMKHGQAPDGDCPNGKGANFRMSVYKFGELSFSFQDINTSAGVRFFSLLLGSNAPKTKSYSFEGIFLHDL